MRTPSLLATLTVISLAAVPTSVHAQAEQEVLAAIENQMAAWNVGDITTFGTYYAPGVRGFNLDGSLLIVGFNPQMIEAAIQAGVKIELSPRDIDVTLFGSTAVAVGYLDGSLTIPGSPPQEGTWRYSETRVKTDGVWKVVQYHFSALNTPGGGRRQ